MASLEEPVVVVVGVGIVARSRTTTEAISQFDRLWVRYSHLDIVATGMFVVIEVSICLKSCPSQGAKNVVCACDGCFGRVGSYLQLGTRRHSSIVLLIAASLKRLRSRSDGEGMVESFGREGEEG